MPDKEQLTEILDASILRMEIADPSVIWFSERLEWVVNQLLQKGVTFKRYGAWKPLGQLTYGCGRSYTHYCSLCGAHGYDDMHFCHGCGADMGFEREEPIKEMVPEL